MEIVKPIPTEIKEILLAYECSGILEVPHYKSGKRSTIYKLDDQFCLKTYPSSVRYDGITESKALLALQGKSYSPNLYAYSEGKFILIEWIKGLDLDGYQAIHNHCPVSLIYDMFSTELDLINSGFVDWDFKLDENLFWDESGEIKRLDFGICEPVGDMENFFRNDLIDKIKKIYENDPDEVRKLAEELHICGIPISEIKVLINDFKSRTPKLV